MQDFDPPGVLLTQGVLGHRMIQGRAEVTMFRSRITKNLFVAPRIQSVQMSEHLLFRKGHEVVEVQALGEESLAGMRRNQFVVHLWCN